MNNAVFLSKLMQLIMANPEIFPVWTYFSWFEWTKCDKNVTNDLLSMESSIVISIGNAPEIIHRKFGEFVAVFENSCPNTCERHSLTLRGPFNRKLKMDSKSDERRAVSVVNSQIFS